MTTLMVLATGLAGLAWLWERRPQQRRTVLGVLATGGLGFQFVHAVEHLVQAGAWLHAPAQPPLLTPWAVVARDALAVGGSVSLGDKLLHLLGNLVFLAGLAALAALARGSGRTGGRGLQVAVAVQTAHVVEHVALTVTAWGVGRSIGVSTLFGLLEPGPRLWTLRIAVHLVLNMVATAAAAVAVVHWTRPSAVGSQPVSDHAADGPGHR